MAERIFFLLTAFFALGTAGCSLGEYLCFLRRRPVFPLPKWVKWVLFGLFLLFWGLWNVFRSLPG